MAFSPRDILFIWVILTSQLTGGTEHCYCILCITEEIRKLRILKQEDSLLNPFFFFFFLSSELRTLTFLYITKHTIIRRKVGFKSLCFKAQFLRCIYLHNLHTFLPLYYFSVILSQNSSACIPLLV